MVPELEAAVQPWSLGPFPAPLPGCPGLALLPRPRLASGSAALPGSAAAAATTTTIYLEAAALLFPWLSPLRGDGGGNSITSSRSLNMAPGCPDGPFRPPCYPPSRRPAVVAPTRIA